MAKQKIDMWHVICDMWHLTQDTWHMTHCVRWTFSQNLSSLALPVLYWQCLEDIWTKGWLNEWVTEVIVESPGYIGSIKKTTCDMWHVRHDTWHMTHSVGWTFSQNVSFLALLVSDWQCLEDIWTKGWPNEWVTEVIVESPGYTGSVKKKYYRFGDCLFLR